MIKRECEIVDNLTTCQVPYSEEGLSGIVDLLLLVFLLVFIVSGFMRILSRFFR